MIDAAFEFMAGIVELVATALNGRGRSRYPGVGTCFRARTAIALSGRDRRTDDDARSFVVRMPAGTVVRVELVGRQDVAEICVCLADRTEAQLLPLECRADAMAFGYVLEVPPLLLRDAFEPFSPARSRD
jgi:hypothetical protein